MDKPPTFLAGETREQFIEDLKEAVMTDINQIEAQHKDAERARARLMAKLDVVVLPVAVLLIIVLQLCQMGSLAEGCALVPNAGLMIVRLCRKTV